MDSAFSAIENQVQILQTKTTRLEENYYDMFQEAQTTSSALMVLEEKHSQTTTMLEEKIDKLKGFSRRDNLKFFNIPQSTDEDYETCVMKVVSILQDTVPNRQWCRGDTVRAHRHWKQHQRQKPKRLLQTATSDSKVHQMVRQDGHFDERTRSAEKERGDGGRRPDNEAAGHHPGAPGERSTRVLPKATDWWWPGLSSTTPSTAVASPTPRDVAVPAVGGSTQGTAATLHASSGTPGTNVRHQSTKPREEYDSRPYQSELRRQLPLEQRNATLGRQQDHRLAERIPGEHRQPPLRPMDPAILHQREFQGLALGMVRSAALPRLAGLRPSPQRLPVARRASQELQEPHTSGGTERRRHQPPGKTA